MGFFSSFMGNLGGGVATGLTTGVNSLVRYLDDRFGLGQIADANSEYLYDDTYNSALANLQAGADMYPYQFSQQIKALKENGMSPLLALGHLPNMQNGNGWNINPSMGTGSPDYNEDIRAASAKQMAADTKLSKQDAKLRDVQRTTALSDYLATRTENYVRQVEATLKLQSLLVDNGEDYDIPLYHAKDNLSDKSDGYYKVSFPHSKSADNLLKAFSNQYELKRYIDSLQRQLFIDGSDAVGNASSAFSAVKGSLRKPSKGIVINNNIGKKAVNKTSKRKHN